MTTTAAPAAVTSDEALRVARLDAEQAYRSLDSYRILVTREPDGWHVDYELKDPTWNGGGPHYVIDPTNCQIIAKRYEQ
jgi:hypothetical protein